jgi:catechol 2,3-dioxygenase-like lactoylglutathione lyase family enzyme
MKLNQVTLPALDVAASVAFYRDDGRRPWLWREARLVDPSGNVICLYHAGANRLDPPWRVGA